MNKKLKWQNGTRKIKYERENSMLYCSISILIVLIDFKVFFIINGDDHL